MVLHGRMSRQEERDHRLPAFLFCFTAVDLGLREHDSTLRSHSHGAAWQ